jgi:uncharacterized RDD family membrane protein YckC
MNRYDTFWRRLLAAIIDSALLSTVNWLRDCFEPDNASRPTALIWSLVAIAIPIGYSVTMHARLGQTVGKMLAGVIVLDVSESRRITFRQAILRDIGLIVLDSGFLIYQIVVGLVDRVGMAVMLAGGVLGSASAIWFVVEVVTMLSNEKRRALHDCIAGTVVVKRVSLFFPESNAQSV